MYSALPSTGTVQYYANSSIKPGILNMPRRIGLHLHENGGQGIFRQHAQYQRYIQGGDGPATVDEMHRQILDQILSSPPGRWVKLSAIWDEKARQDLVLAWHRLDDNSRGLHALKKKLIIGTLSNGNIKLLDDMAKHADLPWDVVFSSELFHSYKPNPKVYLGDVHYLALEPHQVGFVAAHIDDCLTAKKCGLKTVYVRRDTEDLGMDVDESIADYAVNGLEELARVIPGEEKS